MLEKRPRGEPISIQLPADDEGWKQGRRVDGFPPREADLAPWPADLAPLAPGGELDLVEALRNPDESLFK